MSNPQPFEHLSPGAIDVLYKGRKVRIDFVTGNTWTVKFAQVGKWVGKKIASSPSNRAEGLILHSRPFNGKTSILKYIRREYARRFENEDAIYPKQPVIYVLAEADTVGKIRII